LVGLCIGWLVCLLVGVLVGLFVFLVCLFVFWLVGLFILSLLILFCPHFSSLVQTQQGQDTTPIDTKFHISNQLDTYVSEGEEDEDGGEIGDEDDIQPDVKGVLGSLAHLLHKLFFKISVEITNCIIKLEDLSGSQSKGMQLMMQVPFIGYGDANTGNEVSEDGNHNLLNEEDGTLAAPIKIVHIGPLSMSMVLRSSGKIVLIKVVIAKCNIHHHRKR
jgi:hypothetical protein